MILVKGRIVAGSGRFRQRMPTYRNVFTKAAGEELQPGPGRCARSHTILDLSLYFPGISCIYNDYRTPIRLLIRRNVAFA